jgi:hypothetical protein
MPTFNFGERQVKVYVNVVGEGCTFSCAYGLFAEHTPTNQPITNRIHLLHR